MAVLLLFLFSLDSLFASLALGVSRVARARQLKLALAFGICDALASLLRSVLRPPAIDSSWLTTPQFRLAAGIYLLAVLAVWLFRATKPFGSPLLWTVPIVLSIDNLLAPGTQPFAAAPAILVAVASTSMSLVGFRLGALLRDFAHHLTSHRAFLRRSIP